MGKAWYNWILWYILLYIFILGEFSPFLSRVNENLKKAKEFCANENQLNMLDCYIDSFKTGSIKKHIESQRWWVKDKKPVIETNIGWVETYIDPMGVRAYFEVQLGIFNKIRDL